METGNPLVTWLKGKLFLLPGYARFQASHNHRIQNPDIIESWNFASDFYSLYYRTVCEATVSNSKLSYL